MSRRLSLLIAAVVLLSLGGCVILPGHREHCCWRYYGAVAHSTQEAAV